MKKIIILLISFLFFFSAVVASLAQETPKEDTTSTPSSVKTIDYTLPYPGLLPDNPLYVLKAIRDRIIEVLISDPIKKANFELLAADKRLNEGVSLFNKGEKNYALAETAISKGENYFEKGIAQVEKAKKQGIVTAGTSQRFYLASLKHREVIKSLINKSRGDIKQRLLLDDKRMEEFEKKLK